jgi:hypothetical protein
VKDFADPLEALTKSIGRTRWGRRSIARRHAFVAIVYSHERGELRASRRSRPRQARSSASSASWIEPSIR